MSDGTAFQRLHKDPRYTVRICGMPAALAQEFRRQLVAPAAGLPGFAEGVRAAYAGRVGDGPSVGLVLGSPMRDFLSLAALDEDVVVVLLTDPTDIDSKQVTAVREGVPNHDGVFSALYKFNPLSQQQQQPQHPRHSRGE